MICFFEAVSREIIRNFPVSKKEGNVFESPGTFIEHFNPLLVAYPDIIKIAMSILKGDSLLSNISNVSVKIEHNYLDGSGFFKQTGYKWIEDEREIKAEDIPEDFHDVENLMNYGGVSEEPSHPAQDDVIVKIEEKSESPVIKREISE